MENKQIIAEELNDEDYKCDKCETIGSFLDGTMWGIGKGNMETCLCNECINKLHLEENEDGDIIIIENKIIK